MATSSIRPAPSAVEHVVGVDELFFSTTDRRGVITSGNSVFARISQYPIDELIGSPHNLIRHPAMPAGVFELMWRRLDEGRPMAGYVRNMTADGGTYWVFATITPFGDGYLSVRAAPLTPIFDVVAELYEAVRHHELEYAAAGNHRGEVARYGAAFIEEALRHMGFPSYDDFMYEALAAEVAVRRERRTASYERPRASGPAAAALGAVTEMQIALDQLSDRMARYGRLAEQLAPASRELSDSVRELELVAEHAEAVGSDSGVGVLRNISRVMREPLRDAVDAFSELAPQLDRLLHMTRRQRFATGLARLHAEMAASFAAEAIDGEAPLAALGEVRELTVAMGDDVVDMLAGIETLGAQLRLVSGEIGAAAERNERYSYFLGEWQRAAVRKAAHSSLRQILEPAERHTQATRDRLAALRRLADECQANSTAVAPRSFQAPLERIRRATATGDVIS